MRNRQFASATAGSPPTATTAPDRTRPRLPSVVWVAWALGAAACVQLAPNPLYVTLVIVAAGIVADAHGDGPFRGAFRIMVLAGVGFGLLRLVLTALTTHGLGSAMFHVPAFTLPRLFGGFTVGGTVEGAVVARAAAEAWALVGILAVFGAFNAVASHYELVRTAPRAFYEVGLALTVALAFVPSTVATVAAVREADRARTGGRVVRRGRLVRQLVPILETGLERAISLAESMDARGFGHQQATPADVAAGWLALASVVSLGAAFVALVGRAGTAAALLVATSLIALVTAIAVASKSSARVRYRPVRATGRQWLVGGIALIAAAVVAIIAGTGDATLTWPGATLAIPAVDPLVVLALCGLALPAVVA